ncbi:MAG: NADPH-dependent FMN reductase [Pseudomonadota bacterium]
MLKFVVMIGSVRTDRMGERVALLVKRHLETRGHQVDLVDPMMEQQPMLDRMYKEHPTGEAPAGLERLAQLYRAADAFVPVAGEYNHGIQPALKNLLDHFLEEYFFRPAGIVCYSGGPFGGVRAAMALRMALAEMGMVTIPSLFPVSSVHRSLGADGTAVDTAYDRRIGRFLDELEWYARALRDARDARGTPY